MQVYLSQIWWFALKHLFRKQCREAVLHLLCSLTLISNKTWGHVTRILESGRGQCFSPRDTSESMGVTKVFDSPYTRRTPVRVATKIMVLPVGKIMTSVLHAHLTSTHSNRYFGVFVVPSWFIMSVWWKIPHHRKIPICQACGAPSTRETSEREEADLSPIEGSTAVHSDKPEQTGLPDAGSPDIELKDPYLNPLEEIALDTGSVPCAKHGYDHLSRDPACEFCRRVLGPLYHHLSKKYGRSLGDQTPTLSFDFSGPHPVAVTGARFRLLFVWRLDTIRLLWAFAVAGKQKNVFDPVWVMLLWNWTHVQVDLSRLFSGFIRIKLGNFCLRQ